MTGLAKCLTDANATLGFWAANAIAGFGPTAARPWLLAELGRILGDPFHPVREKAAQALQGLGAAAAGRPARDRGGVRDAVLRFVVKFDGESDEGLREQSGDGETVVHKATLGRRSRPGNPRRQRAACGARFQRAARPRQARCLHHNRSCVPHPASAVREWTLFGPAPLRSLSASR